MYAGGALSPFPVAGMLGSRNRPRPSDPVRITPSERIRGERPMFEREVRLNGLMNAYLARLLEDVDETKLAVAVPGAANPPAWILAHLAVANDYALRFLGGSRLAPAEWHKRFGRGMSPNDDPRSLPSKTELLQTLAEGGRQIAAAATKADPARMNEKHNVELFNETPVATIGDLVAHLLTTHLALHVGQLSAWRRGQGKPPLF